MATVTKTYKECDRAGCRNRTGVEEYTVVFKLSEGNVLLLDSGELCPTHVKMARRFMATLFKNTKQYDEPEDND